MYRLKKTVRPGQRVLLTENLKPSGRKIFLDDASQAQLKYLYDIGHEFVEFVPEKIEAKIPETKKPDSKDLKIVRSGTD